MNVKFQARRLGLAITTFGLVLGDEPLRAHWTAARVNQPKVKDPKMIRKVSMLMNKCLQK